MGLRIDQKTYVTQFDTKRNIPFYSAYMITDPQGQRLKTWTRSEVSDTWQADIPGVLFQFEIYWWEAVEIIYWVINLYKHSLRSYCLLFVLRVFVNKTPTERISNQFFISLRSGSWEDWGLCSLGTEGEGRRKSP